VRGGRQKYRRSGEYLPQTVTSSLSILAADFAGSQVIIVIVTIYYVKEEEGEYT